MKINEIYPNNENDRLNQKISKHVRKIYPDIKIKNIKIGKKNIIIKTEYGHICYEKKVVM